MSRSSVRRARFRGRALVVVIAGLAPWAAPDSPLPSARADLPGVDGPAARGCGRSWGSIDRLGDLPGGLLEVSGFVASARYPGVAWMIQDSDNPESLYSFELDGDRPRWKEFPVSGAGNNVDWEDIAYSVGADGVGRIWILENGIETGPKKIYEVLEPDPQVAGPVRVAATYRVEYPGANLNTETMFSIGGQLAVVS